MTQFICFEYLYNEKKPYSYCFNKSTFRFVPDWKINEKGKFYTYSHYQKIGVVKDNQIIVLLSEELKEKN